MIRQRGASEVVTWTPQKPSQWWIESVSGLSTEEGNSFVQGTLLLVPAGPAMLSEQWGTWRFNKKRLRIVVHTKGQSCPSEYIWQRLETFSVGRVGLGEGCYWYPVGGGQRRHLTPYSLQDSPSQQTIIQPQRSRALPLRTLALDCY